MGSFPNSVQRLIDRFARFPGIGKKTAQRMAFQVMKSDDLEVAELAESIMDVKSKIHFCTICGSITEDDPCNVCTDPKRNQDMICVVEDPQDIFIFERSSSYRGVYHVLGGILSPLDGIGPDDLNLNKLIDRVKENTELILATNPSIEGDTTALYINKLFSAKNIKITRLARGIPVGSAIEYTDEATLAKALEGRTVL
ncbi:MAG: recombination protein RecR [Planctomycetia bacterium]|nr:recombination protein RecR [Planctomycetia bacterium]